MLRSLTISIPVKIPAELSSNASRFTPPGMKFGLAKEITETAGWCIAIAKRNWEEENGRDWILLQVASLEMAVVFAENRQRDTQNLLHNTATKKIVDQLPKLGIIFDDDHVHLRFGMPTIVVDKERAPLVILTVKEVQPCAGCYSDCSLCAHNHCRKCANYVKAKKSHPECCLRQPLLPWNYATMQCQTWHDTGRTYLKK